MVVSNGNPSSISPIWLSTFFISSELVINFFICPPISIDVPPSLLTRPVVRIRIRGVVIRIRVRDTAIRIRIVVTPIEHTVLGDSALNFCKGNLFFSDICQNQKKIDRHRRYLSPAACRFFRFTLYETSLAALYLATLDALTILPRKARRDPQPAPELEAS